MLDFLRYGYGEVKGLLSLDHLIYVLFSIFFIVFMLTITRHKSNEEIKKYIKIISITSIILEILKIIWNLTLRPTVSINDYMPLYFCSLFMYASFYTSFIKDKKSIVYKFFNTFMFYGNISGGLVFLCYPTTSLQIFPILHVLSIHSLFFHSFMVICALWTLRFYNPSFKDFKYYAIGLLTIEGVLIILNFSLNTNFMMLNNAFSIKILELIQSGTGYFYPILVAICQLILSFALAYSIYTIIIHVYSLVTKIQTKSVENKLNK